jgi:hypothetical protein
MHETAVPNLSKQSPETGKAAKIVSPPRKTGHVSSGERLHKAEAKRRPATVAFGEDIGVRVRKKPRQKGPDLPRDWDRLRHMLRQHRIKYAAANREAKQSRAMVVAIRERMERMCANSEDGHNSRPTMEASPMGTSYECVRCGAYW